MKRFLSLLVLFLIPCNLLAAPSYSSGGSRPSSSSSSSRPSYSSGSSSSRPSYSSGSKPSYSSKPSTGSSSKPSYSSGSSSKPSASSSTYSSGSSSSSTSSKPQSQHYDSQASREQAKVGSTSKASMGTTTKSTYTDSKGTSHNIDPKDEKIGHLRTQLSQERWENRQLRMQNYYSPYYGRPDIFLGPCYNTLFWYMLLDRSLDERAMWMYCHRSDMDDARYRELLAKDASLEAKVRQLEAQKVKADPNYIPSGMDEDAMYTDSYVNSVYNPESKSSGWGTFFVIMGILFGIGLVIFVVWLIFFYRGW